ncbi:hypothetical protein ABZS93_23360 [Streptomyces sp900116325]|uniref:hypothetical protein n=1 Tax=Streptomyces sp. 900116325 TaxID=3154295 RepID=UPI0033AD373E
MGQQSRALSVVIDEATARPAQPPVREQRHPATPSQTLDALLRDVRRHAGGKNDDDQTLPALHRPPVCRTP